MILSWVARGGWEVAEAMTRRLEGEKASLGGEIVVGQDLSLDPPGAGDHWGGKSYGLPGTGSTYLNFHVAVAIPGACFEKI